MSPDEKKKMEIIKFGHNLVRERKLTLAQLLFYLNKMETKKKGKDLSFKKEKRLAITALYEWTHDIDFNKTMSNHIQEQDLTGTFFKSQIPTLILEGDLDTHWANDKLKLFSANHPKAEIIEFKKSGHNPFNDEPDFFLTV